MAPYPQPYIYVCVSVCKCLCVCVWYEDMERGHERLLQHMTWEKGKWPISICDWWWVLHTMSREALHRQIYLFLLLFLKIFIYLPTYLASSGLSWAGRIFTSSFVMVHGLSSCSPRPQSAWAQKLQCSTRASSLGGLWDLSSLSRDWTASFALQGGFLTIGPPGKCPQADLNLS